MKVWDFSWKVFFFTLINGHERNTTLRIKIDDSFFFFYFLWPTKPRFKIPKTLQYLQFTASNFQFYRMIQRCETSAHLLGNKPSQCEPELFMCMCSSVPLFDLWGAIISLLQGYKQILFSALLEDIRLFYKQMSV